MKKVATLFLVCIILLSACAVPNASNPVTSMPPSVSLPTVSSSTSTLSGASNADVDEWREETFTTLGHTVTVELPFYIHIELDEMRAGDYVAWLIFDEDYLPNGMVTTPNDMLGGSGYYSLGGISLSGSAEIPLEKVDDNTYRQEFYEHVYEYTRQNSICTDPPSFYELGDYFVWSRLMEEPHTFFLNLKNALVINFYHEADTEELKTLFETIVLSAQVQ